MDRGARSAAVLALLVLGVGCGLDWSVVSADRDQSPAAIEVPRDARGVPAREQVLASIYVDPTVGSAADAALDGTTRADAGSDGEADSPPVDCDVDRDGFDDLSKPGCSNAPGPPDCDDGDARAHPGQSFLEDLPTSRLAGDWNCVDGVEKLYATNVSCGLLAIGACGGVQGFSDDPGCGETGTLVECAVQGLVMCGVGTTSTRKQACK